jgi:hypothetical protein
LRKKTFLVIGGYDAACIPEYSYGGNRSNIRRFFIQQSCQFASRLLPISSFVLKELLKNVGGKDLKSKSVIVHNGIDLTIFPIGEDILQERAGVVCISTADTVSRAMIKGLDTYLEVAEKMPKVDFLLVGPTGLAFDHLMARCPHNTTIVGPIPRIELIEILRRKKVICQFSRFESFGMAVAEGMLSGCIPITFEDIGTSEILSDNVGYVVPRNQMSPILAALGQAINASEGEGVLARERILSEFSLDLRVQRLLAQMQ